MTLCPVVTLAPVVSRRFCRRCGFILSQREIETAIYPVCPGCKLGKLSDFGPIIDTSPRTKELTRRPLL